MSHPSETGSTQEIKFTPSGQAVLDRALATAKLFQHEFIGTEHLVVGVVLQPEFAKVFLERGITPPKLRSAIEFVVGRGKAQPQVTPELTSNAGRAIEIGHERAVSKGRKINAGDIFFGIIKDDQGMGVDILETFGLTHEDLLAIPDRLPDELEGDPNAFTRLVYRLREVNTDDSLGQEEKRTIFERATTYVAGMQEKPVYDPYDFAME